LDGKKSTWPCRGYNLKSWLRFEKSLTYVIETTYQRSTKEVFETYWNMGLEECQSPSPADTKSKASKKAAASKPKKSAKAVKKQSDTNASAKPVKKNMKAGTTSSTTPKKKATGSTSASKKKATKNDK
jgi:hypothetical protein